MGKGCFAPSAGARRATAPPTSKATTAVSSTILRRAYDTGLQRLGRQTVYNFASAFPQG